MAFSIFFEALQSGFRKKFGRNPLEQYFLGDWRWDEVTLSYK